MNEDKVRQIVREEMDKNFMSGSPVTTPHTHDGLNSLRIPLGNIVGPQPIPSTPGGVLSTENIGPRTVLATPNGTTRNVVSIPLLTISGDLGGESVDFLGGTAPDGTLLLYKTSSGWQLWIQLLDTWHGVDLPLTT